MNYNIFYGKFEIACAQLAKIDRNEKESGRNTFKSEPHKSEKREKGTVREVSRFKNIF